MKKVLVFAVLLWLIPAQAIGFEIVIPFSFDGFIKESDKPGIIEIALSYNGYDTNKNRKELKQLLTIDPAHIPWCAGFINFVLDKAGYESTGDLLASSYHNYGIKVKTPIPGDIVLLKREGGSGRHVAFFYGYNIINGVKYIQLLGGNQNNAVNIKSYPLQKVVEYRRPIKRKFS